MRRLFTVGVSVCPMKSHFLPEASSVCVVLSFPPPFAPSSVKMPVRPTLLDPYLANSTPSHLHFLRQVVQCFRRTTKLTHAFKAGPKMLSMTDPLHSRLFPMQPRINWGNGSNFVATLEERVKVKRKQPGCPRQEHKFELRHKSGGVAKDDLKEGQRIITPLSARTKGEKEEDLFLPSVRRLVCLSGRRRRWRRRRRRRNASCQPLPSLLAN